MKPTNIVGAMNEVLSNTYWTECSITEINTNVAHDMFGIPHKYCARVKFMSDERIEAFVAGVNLDGCVLVQEQYTMGVGKYYYDGIFLLGSKLHRKLLKAQLKFIPKEV